MGNTITCGESEAAGGVLDPMIHSGIPDCGANATALPQAGFFVNGTGFPCNNTSLSGWVRFTYCVHNQYTGTVRQSWTTR